MWWENTERDRASIWRECLYSTLILYIQGIDILLVENDSKKSDDTSVQDAAPRGWHFVIVLSKWDDPTASHFGKGMYRIRSGDFS